jgi:NSS family neurotransmitter:Na+ symporter
MSELLEQRENWGSRAGFVLAAIGSAVGLGNLWGFPYKIYSYGGGAFLIPYIIALFVIGLPLIILEFALGHYTQRAAPNAFRRCGRSFEGIGWLGGVMCILIMAYYPVILGYCITYLGYSIQGIMHGGNLPWAAEGIDGIVQAKDFFLKNYLNHHESLQLGPIEVKVLVPVVIAWALMYFCIFKGVNLVDKIVWLTVPIPWIMLVVLAVRGLTLKGSMQGMAYYLTPDWAQLAKPTTWRFAFGQVFFSMSLGWGTMITYSSFLHKKSDLNNNAAIITLSDFATSFIAGIAIFATLGGMAFVTAQAGNAIPVDKIVDGGPSLAFVAFPYTLAQLPYSAWFSFFFFLALITLGIDSAFSITETLLASIVDKTGLKRGAVLIGITVVGMCLSAIFCTGGGLNWIGIVDDIINSTWGAAFLGLLECLVIGWLYRTDKLRKHANKSSDWALGKWWDSTIRIVLPIILGTLFFWNFYDNYISGFELRSPDGEWNIALLVQTLIIVAAFTVAIILTICKNNIPEDVPNIDHMRLKDIAGRRKIVRHFSTSAVIVLFSLGFFWYAGSTVASLEETELLAKKTEAVLHLIAYMLIVSAAVDLFFCEKTIAAMGDLKMLPNKLLGAGGIMSVVSISASAAVSLILLSKRVLAGEASVKHAEIPQTLTLISYVITAFVAVIIVGGLIWCFYRISKAHAGAALQRIEEE